MKIVPKNKVAEFISSDDFIKSVISSAFLRVYDENNPPTLVACGDIEQGLPFVIDIVIPEGVPTGDNREFEIGTVTCRDLPIPLLWQEKTASGHDGSVIVGRIDSIERIAPEIDSEGNEHGYHGLGRARGFFDISAAAREAGRLVKNEFLRGVSADLDKFEGVAELADETSEDTPTGRKIKSDDVKISQSRLTAVTLVAKPSFQECTIRIEEPIMDYIYEDNILEFPIEDGIYEEGIEDDPELFSASLVASAAPVVPPKEWFNNPKLDKPTPLTVDDDGKVYGHIALFNTSHIGMAGRVRPPRSKSNYQYFRTGVLRVDDGTDIPVGQITLTNGHADLHLDALATKKHYDDTASAIVDVTAGEDRFGIYVAGALRPNVTPEQVRAFRAASPSGDWRPINGRLELVGICQVNVPGFPTVRSLVAGGQIQALVAAGSRELVELKSAELESRIETLEQIEFNRQKSAALSVLEPLVEENTEALVASAQQARATLAELSAMVADERALNYEEARAKVAKSLGL